MLRKNNWFACIDQLLHFNLELKLPINSLIFDSETVASSVWNKRYCLQETDVKCTERVVVSTFGHRGQLWKNKSLWIVWLKRLKGGYCNKGHSQQTKPKLLFEFKPHQRHLLFPFSLRKKLHPHCLVLVGSKNGKERDLRMKNCLFRNQSEMNI